MDMPTFADVRAAAQRIAGHVHRTPVLTSRTLDERAGARVFCKCENLQKVGAFKARGAVNAVFALSATAAARGVVTHSSGNHGAAVAYAARVRGVPATVVMPDDAPAVKLAAVHGYGAAVVQCQRSAREATARQIVAEQGRTLIHPFDDPYVIAGQGTAALELLAEVPDLDAILAPVGGGGLAAGTVLVVRGTGARCRVVGAEPEAVDDAYRSLREGVRHPAVPGARTVADGLMTGLGERNFDLLRQGEVEVVTVAEDAILEAARFFVERMKIVVEPSSATVLAALWRARAAFAGRRVGLILTGGNTDLSWMAGAAGRA